MRTPALLLALSLAPILPAAVERDVEFAKPAGAPLLLDASVPEGPGPFGAVIVVHGGGFVRGSKNTYINPLLPVLSDAGLAWFSINYRMAPQGKMEDSLADIAAAVDYVRAHAAQYRIDPQRLALAGESAGGYLVAMFAARHSRPLAAVVDFYGPHDYPALVAWRKSKEPAYRMTDELLSYFSLPAAQWDSPQQLKRMSPITYVHQGMPPFYLIHGTTDAQVDYKQSPLWCEAMKKAGNSCELLTVEGGAHGMENWEKTPAHAQVWKAPLAKWLQKQLAPGRRSIQTSMR